MGGSDPDRAGAPVLATLLDPAGDDQVRAIATALAAARAARIRVLAPERMAFASTSDWMTASANGAAEAPAQAAGANGAGMASTVTTMRPGAAPDRVVADEIEATGAGAVVVQRPPSLDEGIGLRKDAIERIVARSPTDVLVAQGRGDLTDLASILVPVAGGPNTPLAVSAAVALARQTDAWVELFHVVPADAGSDVRAEGADVLRDAEEHLGDFASFDTWLYEANDPADAIAEQSEYYDAVVIGAPTKGRIKRLVFGSMVDEVNREIAVPLVTAHRG